MGTLRDWNEALCRYFLSNPSERILFCVTADVIESIFQEESFEKTRQHALEDFLWALCNDDTGYGFTVRNHTTERRESGWPVYPENIFLNAWRLRQVFENHNRNGEDDFFTFPKSVPPWTAHLALAILGTCMNTAHTGNARFPAIVDLFLDVMGIDENERRRITERTGYNYRSYFFGNISDGSIRYFRKAPLVIQYSSGGERIVRSPWYVLYDWSLKQDGLGTFAFRTGWIRDPVGLHSKFRSDDRQAMIRALSQLQSNIRPSEQVIDQIIIDHLQDFRQGNHPHIRARRLNDFREYAYDLWESCQDEILSVVSGGTDGPTQPAGTVFQIMPYMYSPSNDASAFSVDHLFLRCYWVNGPRPQAGLTLEVYGHTFEFTGKNYATSMIEATDDAKHHLLAGKTSLEYEGHLISTFRQAVGANRIIPFVQDDQGMHHWDPEDTASSSVAFSSPTLPSQSNKTLTQQFGFNIGVENGVQSRYREVRQSGRTKLTLFGGRKVSGGQDNRYLASHPPCLALKTGVASDITILDLVETSDEVGNYCLSQLPEPTPRNGKTVWELSLRTDLEPQEGATEIVVYYKSAMDEVMAQKRFFLVDLADHWQLYPTQAEPEHDDVHIPAVDIRQFTDGNQTAPMTPEHYEELQAAEDSETPTPTSSAPTPPPEQEEPQSAEPTTRGDAPPRAPVLIPEVAPTPEQKVVAETVPSPPSSDSVETAQVEASGPAPPKPLQQCSTLPRVCTSSGVPLAEKGSTVFRCPGCFQPIGRSPRMRNQGVLYKCPNCGFIGP